MKKNNLLNQQFGRLLVIEGANNPGTRKNDTAAYWKCLCQCGKEVVIRGYSLTTGKTKSCGCLNKECSQLDQWKGNKYLPEIAVAKVLHKRSNRYAAILFDHFFQLIQQNCHYCQAPPNLISLSNNKQKKPFLYGTLDRVDSNLDHTLDNVVPCCLQCNRGKLNRAVQEFKQYLSNIKNNWRSTPEEYRNSHKNNTIDQLQHQEKIMLKLIFKNYSSRNKIELNEDQFLQLVTMNCYYCGSPPGNNKKYYYKKKYSFYYSGLDRIDNSLGYQWENVIPCCKYCNSAKGTLTLDQFLSWINNIKLRENNN